VSELTDAVDRILTAEGDRAWAALNRAGYLTVGVAEDHGGADGTLSDAAEILQQVAYHAAAVPLAETTWLAGWLLAEAGQPLPAGPATAGSGEITIADGRVRGRLHRVPFASTATEIIAVGNGFFCRLEAAGCQLEAGRNLAGEDRSEVTIPEQVSAVVAVPVSARDLMLRGALARSVQISGAARRALDLTVKYAGQREQFGRPIAAFQAVQQHLAVLASEVFAADISVRAAVQAAGTPGYQVAAAAAKCNASRAASQVARIAQQVHGAIGVTREYDLHRATTRLWSWAGEFGSGRYWAGQLDRWCGDGDPWSFLVPARASAPIEDDLMGA
jgi:acyl-CoA dehydrogenase